MFCNLCGSTDCQGTRASPVPPQLYVNNGIGSRCGYCMTGSPVARQPNLAGPTGRRWMVASTRIVLLGRECPVVWSLSVPRSLRGLVPRSGSGLPTRFEASLLGHHAASDLLRGGPLRRRPVRRWNRPGEPDCPFGVDCIYLHVCAACKRDFPEPRRRPA